MRTRAMMLPALLAHAIAASAQGLPEESGSERQLEPVNVTARRSIEQRFFAAGSLVVVDRQDIENLGVFSVADVLRQLPGVVVNSAGDGSVEIRMRGMDRNATQLLVDGQRVGSGRSQLPLDQLPPEMVERIEVVRAPTAEFSGATGGTINIVLRQATVKRETVLRATDNRVWGRDAPSAFLSATGPLPGQRPAAEGEAPSQPWAFFFALASTGYILGSDVHRTTIESTGSTETDAAPRYRRHEISLVPRLSGRLGPADQLALRATFLRNQIDGQYDTSGTFTPAGGVAVPFATRESHSYDRRYVQGAADWTHRFAGSKLEASLAASQAREGIERGGTSVPAVGPSVPLYVFDDDRQEDLRSLSAKLTGTRSALLWTLGAQVERRDLAVQNLTGAVATDLDAVLDRYVLWGQNEWEVWGGSTLTAGLRGEMLRTWSTSGATVLVDRRSTFLQPSLHLRKPLSPDLQFRANAARITRNPRIWDLIDRTVISQGGNSIVNPDAIGNPDLRPEKAWTLDTGFERRLPQDGQGGLNLFVRSTSDTIATVTRFANGRWVEQRVNVGDALVWGLELDAKTGVAWAGLPRAWTLAANASLLQSRLTSGVNEGRRIPGQPRYTASMTLAKPVPRGGGFFGGATLALTGRSDLDTSPGITGRDNARQQLDLYVGQLVRGWGYWRFNIYNVTDMRHDRRRGYTDAGGGAGESSSVMTLTPRLYLTVGTQF